MQAHRLAMITALSLAMVLDLAACCRSTPRHVRPRPHPTRPTRIEVGMTKAEVESILGRPHEYSGSGDLEVWHYHKRDGDQVVSMTVVRFRQGVVESFDTGVKPRPPAQRPQLRQPHAAPSPHHGPQPPGAPTAPPPDHGAHTPAGDAAPPPSGRGGEGGQAPTLRPPIKACAKDSDCPSGQRCVQRRDSSKLCQ